MASATNGITVRSAVTALALLLAPASSMAASQLLASVPLDSDVMGGAPVLFNSMAYTLAIGGMGGGGSISTTVDRGAAAQSTTLLVGQRFDGLARALTDGSEDYVHALANAPVYGGNYGIGFGYESAVFSSSPAQRNGIDFAGSRIDRVKLTVRDGLETPGRDLLGDGVWSDFSFHGTLEIYGAPIEQAGLLGGVDLSPIAGGIPNPDWQYDLALAGRPALRELFHPDGNDRDLVLTSGPMFESFVASLTNGINDEYSQSLQYSAGGIGWTGAESDYLWKAHGNANAVDFAGDRIDRIEVFFRNGLQASDSEPPPFDEPQDGLRVSVLVYGQAVPEPSIWMLLIAGLTALSYLRSVRAKRHPVRC